MNTPNKSAVTILGLIDEEPVLGLSFKIDAVEHSAYLDLETLTIDTDAVGEQLSSEWVEAVNAAFAESEFFPNK